jgi:hypothetical protein
MDSQWRRDPRRDRHCLHHWRGLYRRDDRGDRHRVERGRINFRVGGRGAPGRGGGSDDTRAGQSSPAPSPLYRAGNLLRTLAASFSTTARWGLNSVGLRHVSGGVDRLSVELPAASVPVEAGLAPLLRCLQRERSRHGSACCPDRKPSLEFLLRSILSPRSPKWRAVRSASCSCVASYLKSVIRPSPSLFSTCPTRPITAFDIHGGRR